MHTALVKRRQSHPVLRGHDGATGCYLAIRRTRKGAVAQELRARRVLVKAPRLRRAVCANESMHTRRDFYDLPIEKRRRIQRRQARVASTNRV